MPRDFFPAEDLYPSETLYPSSCWKEEQALFDILLHSLVSGKSDILLHNEISGKSDILLHNEISGKSDILLHNEISGKSDILLAPTPFSALFDILLHDELSSAYDLQLLIPELTAIYGIKELPWNKEDFMGLLKDVGDELKTSERDFKGIFKRLEAARSFPDSIEIPAGGGIVYVDPDLQLTENDLITRKGRVYRLKSQEVVKYIGANPIYRVLGLEEYMPSIEFSSVYDLSLRRIACEFSGIYDVAWPTGAELGGLYDIQRNIVPSELSGLYDIIKVLPKVLSLRAEPDSAQNIWTYWSPIEDDDLKYYKVHRSTTAGFTPSDDNLVGLPKTNQFKHNDLAASTTYYFRVCAVSKLGVAGEYSDEASATTSA